ncbi:hypothetical protein V8G54_010057, partial [Vigna mungo]
TRTQKPGPSPFVQKVRVPAAPPHFPHSCLVSLPNETTKGMTSDHADATPPLSKRPPPAAAQDTASAPTTATEPVGRRAKLSPLLFFFNKLLTLGHNVVCYRGHRQRCRSRLGFLLVSQPPLPPSKSRCRQGHRRNCIKRDP